MELIDTEFRQVWNNTRASKTNCLVKALLFVPGAYLFCWGPVMLDKLDAERQLAVHGCIAKLNKYVMIPRGLYMKMFETSAGGYDGTHQPTLYYWIQIATTLQAAQDLKQTLNYDPSKLEVRLATCCGCDPNKDVPTEETVGEDSQFQSRWPHYEPLEIPDATINSSRQEVWDLVARM
jgi:hypothetical protein